MQTKSKTIVALLFACMLALASVFAFGVPALAASSTGGGTSSDLSGWLDDYSEYDEELLAKDRSWNGSEMNPSDDSARTFDYGVRIPTTGDSGEFTSYLGGGSIDGYTPGAYIGNGMTVAENTAKLALKTIASGSGSARFRYAYPVELNGLTVDFNFSQFETNDHLSVIYSGNYNSFRHGTAPARGLTLTYYDDPTAPGYIKINFGLNNATALTGMTDLAFPVDEEDPESYSVKTIFEETDTQLLVTVANGGENGVQYTVTVEKSECGNADNGPQLEDEAGRTWINMGAFNDTTGNDTADTYMLFVMRVQDSQRTAYETETLDPLTAAMADYTAEEIEGATVENITAVDEWVAKRAAVQAAYTTDLRISDRAFYAPDEAIAAANEALQSKAGTVVDAYLEGELSALEETFATADGDTTYMNVTQEQYEELVAAYEAAEKKISETYAGLYTSSLQTSYLATAEESLERVSVSLAIAELEDLPLSSSAEVMAARSAYNEKKDAILARIEALSYDESVKTALSGRLNAVDAAITEAESSADLGDLVDTQIGNYETAAENAETLEDIYEALTTRGLIADYSDLDNADALAARVAAADETLSALAWSLVEDRVAAIEEGNAAGVDSYADKAALSKAVAAISDDDLLVDAAIELSAENLARYEAAVSAADELIAAWQEKLSASNVNLQDITGEQTDANSDALTNDVSFTEDGLLYTFTGDQSAIVFNKGYDLTEGVKVTFSVKDWAFLTNDGSGWTSNNVWLYWTNDPSNNRSALGSISLMFWNMVGESFVKSYYETDTEEQQQTMATIAENDGSYVEVTFSVNTARNRYEIAVDYYDANGGLLDSIISFLSYTAEDPHNPATLFADNTVYVGMACFMTHKVGELNNQVVFRSVGDTSFVDEQGGEPTDPDDPSGPTDPDDPGKPEEPEEPTGLTAGAIAGIVIACVVVVAAVVVAVVLVRRKKNRS